MSTPTYQAIWGITKQLLYMKSKHFLKSTKLIVFTAVQGAVLFRHVIFAFGELNCFDNITQ